MKNILNFVENDVEMVENVSEGRGCCYFLSGSCHIPRTICGRSGRAGTLERESLAQVTGRCILNFIDSGAGVAAYVSEGLDFEAHLTNKLYCKGLKQPKKDLFIFKNLIDTGVGGDLC